MALVAAGLDGIDRKLEPPSECSDDLFNLGEAQRAERHLQPLPRSLGDALDALATDEVIRVALGETLSREFIAVKRAQIAAAAEQRADGC